MVLTMNPTTKRRPVRSSLLIQTALLINALASPIGGSTTFIRSLHEQKVPIHAIGTQVHLNLSNANSEQLERSLTQIAILGLPIHVTDLGINDAVGEQGRTYADIDANAAADQGGLVAEADQRLTQACEAAFAAIGVARGMPMVSCDLTALQDDKRVLENPHKGWYHHFPDNHPDKYRIAHDADLLEFPGMDHVYIRLAWAYLEPKECQFAWGVIDRVIEKWTAHGLGIAFRISCKETNTDRIEQQYATPRWVRDAGAQGGFYHRGETAGPEAPWEPVYDDPVFLEKL